MSVDETLNSMQNESVNLSILLAKSGVSTLLIDADIFNPCVFFHLGISPQSVGMGELLEGKSSLEEVFSIHPGSGLRVISSSIQTYGKIKSERLGKIIDSLNYEYIIIDCPPGFSPLIREAVALSSHIYVVLTPDMPSCSAALKLVTFIRNYVSGKAAFTYFLNRMSNVPYAIHPREVESLFRARLGSIIPEDPNVPKSIASKTPLVLMDPNSKFSKALRAAVPSLLHNRDHRSEGASCRERV